MQNYFNIYWSEKCSKQKLLRKTKHTLYAQHSVSTCLIVFNKMKQELCTAHCAHYLTCTFKSKQQFSRHKPITSVSYLFTVHIIPTLMCCVKMGHIYLLTVISVLVWNHQFYAMHNRPSKVTINKLKIQRQSHSDNAMIIMQCIHFLSSW